MSTKKNEKIREYVLLAVQIISTLIILFVLRFYLNT